MGAFGEISARISRTPFFQCGFYLRSALFSFKVNCKDNLPDNPPDHASDHTPGKPPVDNCKDHPRDDVSDKLGKPPVDNLTCHARNKPEKSEHWLRMRGYSINWVDLRMMRSVGIVRMFRVVILCAIVIGGNCLLSEKLLWAQEGSIPNDTATNGSPAGNSTPTSPIPSADKGSSTTDSTNTGSSTTDSTNTGSSTTDSTNTDSSTTNSTDKGSDTTDSTNTDSNATDSKSSETQTTGENGGSTPAPKKIEKFPLETFTNSKGEVFDLSSFTDYGVYFLEDITIAKLTEEVAKPAPLAGFDFKALVMELINDKNEVIIRKLALEIDPEYETHEDLDFLQGEVLKLLNPQPEAATSSSELEKVNLFAELPVKGLVLESADIVDIYNNVVGETSERMVDLYGRVSIYVNDSEIGADFIRVNLTRRESFAEGNVIIKIGQQVLRSEKALWNLDERYGYVFNARGELNQDYYEGNLVRVNSRTHLTIENGWLTFSKNRDPYYRLSSTHFDVYDEEKWIVQNVLITVGDHPFLWIPYYINFPLSARLALRFGEARREGYYALTEFSFPVPYINKLAFNFNIYEKLGLYASIENKAEFGRISYNFLLAGALYTFNENTRTRPKLGYTYHTGQYIESRSRIRHKVAYNQILSLTDPANTLVRSSIDFSVTNVSDPFITGNFKNNLSHIDWQKLIERHDRDENLYTPRVSDKDAYSIKYTLSAPSLAVGANFDWIYDVYDDPALHEKPVDERYRMYLKTFSLPNLNISHSGTIDPKNTDVSRLFFVNLGYKLGFSYNGRANYKDGERLDAGLGINQTVKPYELINEQYALTMDLGFSRPFSINQGPASFLNLNSDWFSWSLTPNFTFKYKRDWIGKDYTTSNDEEEDRADVTMSYGFGTSFNFNNKIDSFLDHVATLSFTVNTTNTTFRLPRGEFFSGTDDSTRREKNFNYLLSTSFRFNFPSSKRIAIWGASYDYRSMLPYLTADLGYQELAFTSDENIAKSLEYSFNRYSYRRLTSSLSFTQKGYGLFYLPRFDYTFKHNIALSYNLLTVTRSVTPKQSKFESFAGSFSLDFTYNYFRENLINYNNGFTYTIFDANRQEFVPEIISYKMNFGIGFKRKEPSRFYVDIDNVTLDFNWNYYFRDSDYLKDSMSFSFSFGLSIVKRYTINFKLSSINQTSYLYFKNKAALAGQRRVNFLRDIGNSLGFYGVKGLTTGLFKLNAFTVSIDHDIGDWFASFSYTFVPVQYSDDSLRGYYLEHKIAFEVNLKPERDPRGPSSARSNPFFEDIDRSASSNVFKNVIKN